MTNMSNSRQMLRNEAEGAVLVFLLSKVHWWILKDPVSLVWIINRHNIINIP